MHRIMQDYAYVLVVLNAHAKTPANERRIIHTIRAYPAYICFTHSKLISIPNSQHTSIVLFQFLFLLVSSRTHAPQASVYIHTHAIHSHTRIHSQI